MVAYYAHHSDKQGPNKPKEHRILEMCSVCAFNKQRVWMAIESQQLWYQPWFCLQRDEVETAGMMWMNLASL